MPWSLNIMRIRERRSPKFVKRTLISEETMTNVPLKKFDLDLKSLKKELIVEAFRSRGPGGQRKNKKDTAIRLKHIPTGITVIASESRSQTQNLKIAMERLRERLRNLHQPTKKRLPTTIPLSAIERRIREKRIHSIQKGLRKKVTLDENEN